MKKSLFFALFACATLAFVGCEPKPEPQKDPVVITVTPDSLLLGVGNTEKITAVVTPSGTQVQITWTSDNENIVTVTPSGIVMAVGVGSANVIASAEGATADTCVVIVSNDAVYEAFEFSNYGFFGENIEMVDGTEGYIRFTSGDSALCQIGYVTLGVWDSEIVTIGNLLTGAGNILFVPMPMYVIVDSDPAWSQDYGALVGGGGFFIADIGDTIIPYVGKGGKLVDIQSYGDFFKQDIASWSNPDQEVDVNLYLNAFNGGAEMCFINYDAEKINPTYNTATVKYAEFYDSANGLEYYAEVEWLDYLNPGRWFGLAVEMDETGYPTSVIEPYDVRVVEYTYTNMEIEETPTEVSAKGNHYIINPERVHIGKDIKTILNTNRMYKK